MTSSLKNTFPNLSKTIEHIADTTLFQYQREWLFDTSRFKIACKARQIGLSLCLGLEGLLDVLNRQPVFYVSRTERQSIYLLEKFYRWCDYLLESGVPLEFDYRNRNECRLLVDGVGVDVKSLTSHAAGDEGYTGNVYLDEFGLHENDEQIFRSLFPTISWGYKIRIVSRPFGQSNKFYEIFTDAERYPDFKRYRFDIHRAIGDGLSIDVDELRRNFDDEGFRENYLCEFIDESTSYLPYQLIRSCVGDLYAEPDGGHSGTGDSRGARYVGVDVGRKRDRTVVFVLAQLDDRFVTTRIERLKDERFDTQKAFIRHLINEEGITRGCIDATGLGMQLAEELQDEFGFIEPVTFTADSKERMAVRTKCVFENRQIQIPDDNDLISSIHSIRKLVTPSNNIRFDAERTADGHADDFWALALALEAATGRDNMPQLSFIETGKQDVLWDEK
ncbi:MAG: terminase family protein [Ignavibacteriae bacterium]|nr:terminase family protein [Ignavibacteriota bacterium]